MGLFALMLALQTCAPAGPGSLNFFSIDDDVKLGQQLQQEIANDPQQYPLLDRTQYAESYRYLEGIRDEILNSGNVTYRDQFAWQVYIIRDDKTLNAFVTPGGYIYVYTGLIKYLDTEDQLAGVMGHEIAHADRRHSTNNLTKQYGLSILLQMATGSNSSQVSQLLAGLAGNVVGLSFSRKSETDADAMSVKYLSNTEYQCNGAAGFFEKILKEGNGQEPPQFLSTHPSSSHRVKDINALSQQLGCSVKPSGNNYQKFKNSLP